MIVKNEEDVLARCLNSIKDAVDEIIIVDTGSTDNTVQIAKSFGAKVYHFTWVNDFSRARNFAFSKATKNYVMWLDADDVVGACECKKIIELKNNYDPSISAFYFKYHVGFDENNNVTFHYYRERLFRRDLNPMWVEPIHEVVCYAGKSQTTDIAIEHRKQKENPPGRNLKIFEHHLHNGLKLSARLTYYYARELMYANKTYKAIKVFEEFLKSDNGWVENKIEAALCLADCYIKINKKQKAYDILYKSFKYDAPRPQVLCKLGELFLEDNLLNQAIYFYELALSSKIDNDQSLGFVETDYYNFIPNIQLCVIYAKLGNNSLAKKYNDIAGNLKPEHKSVLNNNQYFKNIGY